MDANIVISGAAGQGIQTIGYIIAKTASKSGYNVFSWQEYESRIRGGSNSFRIRVSDGIVNTPLARADIFLPLDKNSRSKYLSLLKEDGIMVDEEETGEWVVTVPFGSIAQEKLGSKLFINTVAAGALAAVMGLDLEPLNRVISSEFARKGAEIVKNNLRAVAEGYASGRKSCEGVCSWELPEREHKEACLISGNEALALGAAAAGCRFIAAYPMTPSTGIITFLAKHRKRLKAQPKIPVKYTRGLLFFAPSRLCVFALLFSNLTQGRKGAETRRVVSIAVFTSFALLYIQLTITKITGFPDSARLKIFAEQAEDEIAAINMAIGAGYAGVRAMTASSGGGFALMVEGISLAGMTETPVVVVLAQRPAPATGLPTRTEQGDLLFAINAGHGEFPKLVFAPSDPKDAFHKIVRAFNLAEKYQIPAIILTDQHLADSYFTIGDFDLDKVVNKSYLADPDEMNNYQRYQLNETGISPILYPGQSHHLVCCDSDEHDEYGHITEDLKLRERMVEKRLKKSELLKREIAAPEEKSIYDAKDVFVSWGSSRNAVFEAVERLRKSGARVGAIHFTELWPLPKYEFPQDMNYWMVESNATGQLGRLLRGEYGIAITRRITRYDGLPLDHEYIMEAFEDG
ncbi:MAG: 2-oxoglutarate synthase subunit KorA [Candidatus Methanogasteraceae archaeon]|nr:MAG: 2-oxoglutarate synthase subunit KorA [ANME-2 cluster archaeon]